MIDTLNIGKYIYNALTQSKTITCKVYPLVADNNAKFPFIIYRRLNLISKTTKDGLYEDTVTMEIDVITETYTEGVDIANKVRDILQKQYVSYQGMEINDAEITMATEEYNSGYIQRLQFQFTLNN